MRATVCPGCNGEGQVYVGIDGTSPITKPCHGCKEWRSRDWIVIPDGEAKVEVKYIPMDTSY